MKIELVGDDLTQVTKIHEMVLEQVNLLGATRLAYLEQERTIEHAAQLLRIQRDALVLGIARRLDAEAGHEEGNWTFDPATMTLSRDGGPWPIAVGQSPDPDQANTQQPTAEGPK